MIEKLNNLTKYSGFIVPIIALSSLIIVILIHPIDLTEPLSQFGYYESTRVIFGIALTLGSVAWYLFARHLDRYWQYTSVVTLLAGICYTIVGWTPYQPYAHAYIPDTHNLMVLFAALLYSLPMVLIGYRKKHEKIARISLVLFFTTIALVITCLIARLIGYGVLYIQVLVLLPSSIWLVMTNKLLLEDLRLDASTKKL